MLKAIQFLIPVFLLSFISGCAPVETSGEEMDYDATKKMVVDILKTDDGKKAIQEIMKDDGMKQNLIMEQTVVSDTIKETLVSEKGKEFWKTAFEDPKFAESYAKSLKSEHEKMIKELMKDPEYRSMLVDVLKDPELEKEMITLLKSNEYRKQMQTVITETFESPLFKAKLQDLIIQASDDISKKQEKKEEEK
ncbi:spore germination lipoprotein GerD [Mesobacillus maritimus]|uniref:spore germination lipoprotein GerD n=1 Tax=Mesobacillus maritimus TaxID=1643336 RepID=UPI00203B06F1|nr:spore germination lipoprotein GerD [Mesobacillus maritimus]MCM3588537.1 spore germination lipoprotein GerD [Mesobacillus maritimus]MCM3671501.1 spore germination lipoprotein GerD [Mesobacillus maritimus]